MKNHTLTLFCLVAYCFKWFSIFSPSLQLSGLTQETCYSFTVAIVNSEGRGHTSPASPPTCTLSCNEASCETGVSVCPSVRLSVCPSVCPFVCPFVCRLSVSQSVCLSVCLSVFSNTVCIYVFFHEYHFLSPRINLSDVGGVSTNQDDAPSAHLVPILIVTIIVAILVVLVVVIVAILSRRYSNRHKATVEVGSSLNQNFATAR